MELAKRNKLSQREDFTEGEFAPSRQTEAIRAKLNGQRTKKWFEKETFHDLFNNVLLLIAHGPQH